MWEFVVVFVVACLLGGWSIPLGLLLGLDAATTYAAALLGTVAVTAVVLKAGAKLGPLMSRMVPAVDRRLQGGRLGRLVGRWGVPAIAVGSIVTGPTVALATALVLEVPRLRFAGWYIATTAALFAVLTLFCAAFI
ncbi:MAG: hypothetical protein ACR2PK_08465 [Acidimicrobiales bacterium]